MNWKYVICAVLVIVGLFIFLYGINVYDVFLGALGTAVSMFGLATYVALKVHVILAKNRGGQNP